MAVQRIAPLSYSTSSGAVGAVAGPNRIHARRNKASQTPCPAALAKLTSRNNRIQSFDAQMESTFSNQLGRRRQRWLRAKDRLQIFALGRRRLRRGHFELEGWKEVRIVSAIRSGDDVWEEVESDEVG